MHSRSASSKEYSKESYILKFVISYILKEIIGSNNFNTF
jgi:hypothetical protein